MSLSIASPPLWAPPAQIPPSALENALGHPSSFHATPKGIVSSLRLQAPQEW